MPRKSGSLRAKLHVMDEIGAAGCPRTIDTDERLCAYWARQTAFWTRRFEEQNQMFKAYGEYVARCEAALTAAGIPWPTDGA